MAANRGEIAIRIFRAARELGIKTAAIYAREDAANLHVRKADEAYMLRPGPNAAGPVDAYLDIGEIIRIAKQNGVDAIHPGYGFLSERGDFAAACEEAGIIFVGPSSQVVSQMGSKTAARDLADRANVPVVPGSDGAVESVEEAIEFADRVGYPVMAKASFGGGGRGMRLCRTRDELRENFPAASSEAKAAFGDGSMFVEKFVVRPRHIEVQILGDAQGNAVHLFERDCSVQRRHQKIVEIAPAPLISPALRERICRDAVALARASGYQNAGTCEFLVDEDENHYFIEMNARLQVEHTVTEEVTGIDIVQAQIRVAEGWSLPSIGIKQEDITLSGAAIQCRVTTEDPGLGFSPGTGRLEEYTVGEGMGIRLDQSGYKGLLITPYFDSLLAKVTARGRDHQDACNKLHRALSETNIRGVPSNVGFVKNVLEDESFRTGAVDTSFIEENPQLFEGLEGEESVRDSVARFLAEQVVNGPMTPLGAPRRPERTEPPVPMPRSTANGAGANLKSILQRDGPEAFARAVRDHPGVLFTDTTWRDAHQSLLATRVRTRDILRIAPATRAALANAYSIENWGGATFDVALRFLRECPWERLERMREEVPDVPFQMLLRGANAVGYTAYPDNVVFKFCDQAVRSGMDVFRVFDSLNYMDNMRLGIDAVGAAGGVIEAAVSYTGDVTDPNATKYTLDYYLKLSSELVAAGAHVLAIKDMAGLLKPRAARVLIKALRDEFPDTPIHVHTHDTSGNGVAAMLEATRAGADAIDAAVDSMSGLTSQPSMGALTAALESEGIPTGVDPRSIAELSEYWEALRSQYAPFECTATMRSGSAEVYVHEIPGGQYTNLHFQAFAMGQADQWPKIKRAYATANALLGDIVKVTPSSKTVGDLAIFMVQNGLETEEDVISQADSLSFPTSVVEFFQGVLGQPLGGFPEPLRSKVLRTGTPNAVVPIKGRPGAELAPFDFGKELRSLEDEYSEARVSDGDVISSALYPQVFRDFMTFRRDFGRVDGLPTYAYFSALDVGESITVEGQRISEFDVKLTAVSRYADEDGMRDVFFEVGGNPRRISVTDTKSAEDSGVALREKADRSDEGSVGAPMPGSVVSVTVSEGDTVSKDDPLLVLSAMKMETVVAAPVQGVVKRIVVAEGEQINAGDLVVQISSQE